MIEKIAYNEVILYTVHNPTPLGNGNYVGLANCRIIHVKFQCKPTFNQILCRIYGGLILYLYLRE